ncbi:hypothetical protein Cfla_0755 [Cellulomonas flavigena DSM 20109]|uniref:Polysaccharide biosynthesis protein n=1 Tax=Cellulomonas flavigena (strain ATCC 482 / DSM 20109 / BCRC 11376 / JCM 18109 / NBRC 3775 / NCIMB 8073 / NRS 134) TaxID=446466 RepID=D5UJE3_CELFN|nr:hypothetical protein [Cellulomonas flavigena]ADG73666.1 hypothetical protein Cfla_0755 [Cellulomonas flavigena DSM 20109]
MDEFGEYAAALLVCTIILGVVRAAVVDTALARGVDEAAGRRTSRRLSLLALVATVFVVALAITLASPYMGVLAPAIYGLVLLDYARITQSAMLDKRAAVTLSAAWSVPTATAAVVSFLLPLAPLLLFGIWALGGAAVGYWHAIRSDIIAAPAWPRQPTESRAALWFTLDYAAGSGGAALSTIGLGAFLGAPALGALRGAGTVLGPINILSSTVRSLMIRRLAAMSLVGPKHELASAVRATIALSALLIGIAAVAVAVPDSIGVAVLGETWAVARPALPAIALEAVLGFVSSVPAAGHRAALAGRRTLVLRLATGIPRPVIVIAVGISAGVVAAAWAMAGIAAVNAAIWWASYVRMLRARLG